MTANGDRRVRGRRREEVGLRRALLVGALGVALATLGLAESAKAACSGADQTITGLAVGPVLGTGGAVDVLSGGAVLGGPSGVRAADCSISTFANGGLIGGGAGAAGSAGGAAVQGDAGRTIGTLANSASGTIVGGAGGAGGPTGGAGGFAVANAGTITTLTNAGSILGGSGGTGSTVAGAGGAGVMNASGATLGSLVNQATGAISGGTGTAGGDGVANAGAITNLDNAGAIGGGGAMGAGLSNTGTIGAFVNSGAIAGGAGGAAIRSAGAGAAIGPIANTGSVGGNVEIDDQALVTVSGGTRAAPGVWDGGTITIGAGDLTFAAGNTTLADPIVVVGGAGTVTNAGGLRVAKPLEITGSFVGSAASELDFQLAGTAPADYGSLDVSGSTTLAGGLGIELASGFSLSVGDVFDLVVSGGTLDGAFDRLSLDGAACSATSTDIWRCGAFDLRLFVMPGPGGLVDLGVVSQAVPEPETWSLLAIGFLTLAGLGTRQRGLRSATARAPRRH